jgi:hypothetical protein
MWCLQSSIPIDPVLSITWVSVTRITGYHARQRLHFVSCYDAGHSHANRKYREAKAGSTDKIGYAPMSYSHLAVLSNRVERSPRQDIYLY